MCNGAELKDTLLADFSLGQRDYIIYKLYPIIKKTLVHFVSEATNNGQIRERALQESNMLVNDVSAAELDCDSIERTYRT